MAKSRTSHSSFHILDSLAKKRARREDCNVAKRQIMTLIDNGASYILYTTPYKTNHTSKDENII